MNKHQDNLKLDNEDNLNLGLEEDSEEIILIEDEEDEENLTTVAPTNDKAWKIMIVDDEPTVHQATQLVLQDFTFNNQSVNLISAYSGAEAMELIAKNPDTAFLLLDVVMESNDAGLKVVKYIREELHNKRVRIILRTGQPGEAPEESIIIDYDINDYKLKLELNHHKLITTAITALRAYSDVISLEESKNEIAQNLQRLQYMQLKLVQNEKMATLGELVTGIAHEINNPVNFITGNLNHAKAYTQDLIEILNLYQNFFPNPGATIEAKIAENDLDFLLDDLPKIIASMEEGTKRIRKICTSMKTFSRSDMEAKVAFNIHDGIDSTLMILQHRLKANKDRPAIEIIKEYGDLPEVQCFPGQLNQVFMNILANAIDALEVANQKLNYQEIEANPSKIRIKTEALTNNVTIKIKDNGPGMPKTVQKQVFEYLFTTKKVGKGTGLGLSISRQIIEEKHGGKLICHSVLGQGTEFTIELPCNKLLAEVE